MSNWGQAELERRLSTAVKIGTISAVDHSSKRIRVSAGGMTSAWLPWPAEAGRNYVRWRPLREGQQVVLVSPSGDLTQAVIAGMLYTSSISAPDDSADLDVILFDDGTRLEYDSGAHKLTASVSGSAEIETETELTATVGTELTATAGTDVNVTAAGAATVAAGTTVDATAGASITLAAPVINLTGAVVITGPLSAGPGAAGSGATINGGFDVINGDVTADGTSLKGHTHTGDDGGETSPPL